MDKFAVNENALDEVPGHVKATRRVARIIKGYRRREGPGMSDYEVMQDLLADLMHWHKAQMDALAADPNADVDDDLPRDFYDLVDRGRTHFRAESD